MGARIAPHILALVALVTTLDVAIGLREMVCTTGNEAVIQPDADAFIAGFFGMHRSGANGVSCGGIGTGEMQVYEAIRWALDRLNKKDQILNGELLNDHFIPGVKIGMIAQDYCSNPSMAIKQASALFPQTGVTSYECTRNTNKLMLGLMGASSSDDTKVLQGFAVDNDLPLVSFSSTAPELSDTDMYKNFMRTIPPDGLLAKTIVEFLGTLDWKYVVVVYTENSYGRGAYHAIRPYLAEAGICLTAALGADPNDDSNDVIDDHLRRVMETNTTGVIYLGNSKLIDAFLRRGELYNGAGQLQWVVTDSVALSEKFLNQKYPRGLVSVVPAGRKIIEFEDHWVRIDPNNPSTENPWYKDMYMAREKCNLVGFNAGFPNQCVVDTETQRRNDFVQDQFVESAVHAVYIYARALKQAHMDLCGGTPGMCLALRTYSTADFYSNYMKNIDFTYGKQERVESLASFSLDPYNAAAQVQFVGNDIANPSFEIFNFNDYPYGNYKFQSVATYIRGLLEVITARLRFYDQPRDNVLGYVPRSNCPMDPCGPCLGAILDPKYVYIPGDVVINAAFSIHRPGNKPMTCGDFDTSFNQGIQNMEAFIFAINLVNTGLGSGRLNGVTLGGLGFDDCMNPVMANQLITEVQRYDRDIVDENGENKLDPRSVEVFMSGGINQQLSVTMAHLMNTMKRPVIAAETTTTVLNDDNEFPYFIRANYDLNYVAKSFVNIAKRNSWRYLQVVHHYDNWGLESMMVLKKIAAEEGICVVASFGMGGDNMGEVVDGLRRRTDVQPVVLFLRHELFRMFMEGMKMKNATGEFQLMSLVGDARSAVSGYEQYAEGMVSFKLWNGALITSQSLNDKETLKGHLRSLDPSTYTTNPWMKEWYEATMGCSFTPSAGQTQCGTANMFGDGQFSFELNTDVISVIYGVISAAQGLDETLRHYCGNNYVGICGNFRNAYDKGMMLAQQIVTKTSYNRDPVNDHLRYSFNDERMGQIPFVYYNLHKVNNELVYSKVGEFRPATDFLQLEANQLLPGGVMSTCPGICMECLYLFGYQKYMYIDGDIIIPGIFDVHYQGDSPYSCADMRVENGFQYTEAFRYAIREINRGNAGVRLNPGVTLGGLGFDGCTDSIRASAIVTGMYSGAYPPAESDLGRENVNVGDFAGWMSYDSESTVNIARILQRHNVPAVTAGATTPVLDDKDEFTTFFRTIPSDSMVAEAMAKLSYTLGFKYIITLNAPEQGSRDAVAVFRKFAEAEGICIGASYEFETDGTESQLMDYILQSTTRVVAVFSSPDKYIEDLIRAKMAIANNDVIFITNNLWTIPAADAKSTGNSPIGATLSFNMEYNDLYEAFLLYLSGQSQTLAGPNPNPWFREYYMEKKQCDLAGYYKYNRACTAFSSTPIEFSELRQDINVIPTMNAVFSLAEAVHRVLQMKCGLNYTSVCPAFISDDNTYSMIMQDGMDQLSFQDMTTNVFRFLEREADRRLTVSQVQNDGSLNMEGTFYNGVLSLNQEEQLQTDYANVASTCIGQCIQCQQDSTGEEVFMYIAGDIHIAALFDIHEMGGTPYTCGGINNVHGFQLMEAFNWAMEYVNQRKGIFYRKLLGVKLGSLIFDTCSSPVRAGNLVANYHARNFEIRTTDYRIDPDLIDVYVGPMTSEASIRVADVLRELGIPQIGYGASSLQLADQRRYRYFLRTVPADDKQARALISILKKYEFDNIQVISQNSSVGAYAREEFMRLAPLNRICVTAEYIVGQDGKVNAQEAREAVQKLSLKPNAKVVVVIMDDPYTVLKEANNQDFVIDDGYSFIATDKFGFGIAGYENMDGIGRLIKQKKIITLDVESADYPEVDAYLEDKTPDNYMNNPWFKEYYQYIHNCSLGSPSAQYPSVCSQYNLGYSRAEKYIQDPYVLYVINAVFSAALGIHETLLNMCGGEQYFGVCSILYNNGEKREMFLDNIKKVNFVDRTEQPFYFTENGASDRGYHIYEPQNSGRSLHAFADDYYWEDIGSYNDTHYLKMDVQYFPGWESNCELANSCPCVFPEYQPSRYMKIPSDNDLNVVFISDIHQQNPTNNMECGSIDTGSNLQTLLAFMYAIDQVNKNADSKFQASLKLGGVALDTCSNPSRIGQDVYSLLSGEPVCGNEENQVVPPASVVTYMVRNSQNSIAASSMLTPLRITSLSMSATSVELNDKIEHQYFLRTVPPDNVQALVIAQILRRFKWDYVSVVYVENTYGRSARDTLLSLSDPLNPEYCFGRTIPISINADLDEAKSVIDKLNQQIGARVIVTFVLSTQVRLLLQATTEKGLNHRFIWIGSDTWANNNYLTDGYEETAAGALTIQIRSEYSNGFREFVKSLNFTNRQHIPDDWFEEIYQTIFQCRILGSVIKTTYTSICTGDEEFTDAHVPNDPFVLHTIIGIYQIAHGLNQIEECKTSSSIGIASCLSLLQDRKQTIFDSIMNAQHDVLPNDLGNNSFTFKFTADGYGDIGYNVYNYRRNLTSGQYEYIKIGSSVGDLRLDPRAYKSYSFTDSSLPLSRCPIGSTCQCEDTSGGKFSFSRQEDGYVVTEEGQYVDPTTGQLVTIDDRPDIADRFRDIWAIIVATLAAIGAFGALCMFIYLLVVYPVRGGTTILGYMLCFGIILMYVLVFAFIVHATEEICGLRRFCLGLVYAIAYSAIFVKLIDCWRTKDKEDIYLVKYNKIGNPWGLFFTACLVVLVQVMINAEWLILEAPTVERVIYNNKLWPRCLPDDFYDEGLILSNLFVMFIIFLCVIVGLFSFGNDKNHWDCRWLTGCVVLTIPAWMVWCLVAALGEYKVRDAAVAVGLLYNASVMLMCGPLRKLYLLHKYQELLEREDQKSQAVSSQRDYNSMYGQQYDNAPRMIDGDSVRGSHIGTDDVFMYEPKS